MLDCITMKALLLFHLKVGCRLAVRSFVPLFSALLALIMLDMYPAALVASIARALFRSPPDNVYLLLTAALAFALASWAARRMVLMAGCATCRSAAAQTGEGCCSRCWLCNCR